MITGPWQVVARAEVTRRVAHGDRYLETRLFLADGRVMEQVNPGVPDLENDWREVGRYTDLDRAVAALRRDGWSIRAPVWGAPRRLLLALVLTTLLAAAVAYVALTR